MLASAARRGRNLRTAQEVLPALRFLPLARQKRVEIMPCGLSCLRGKLLPNLRLKETKRFQSDISAGICHGKAPLTSAELMRYKL
eukprot:IDg10207t1